MTTTTDLHACLPPALRAVTATITPIAAGLSGAGVYRVDAGEHAYVLKVAAAESAPGAWTKGLHRQELAANAGVAPRIVYVDRERRAVVSELVPDRGFFGLYGHPQTRDAAVALMGRTVRRVHEIPLPPDDDGPGAPVVPVELLARLWSTLDAAGFARPAFVTEAVTRELATSAPPPERAPVLSHNDMNPTNLVYDGERLLLFDWDSSGHNDPYFDLGVLAMFLRMDEATSLGLLSAYDGEPVTALPASFVHYRRLAAVLVGVAFLHLACLAGHAGAQGDESLATTLALGDFYAQLRQGAVDLRGGPGQFAYALTLIKHGTLL